jgi:plastocyanin
MRFPAMSVYFLAYLMSGALAQSGGGGGTSATATASAASSVHTVAVGKDGLAFTPDTLTAAKGDIIEFTFGQGHSVELSTFSNPCNPVDTGAIYSGFPTASDMFTVTVNDTNPMWLYCSKTFHCQSGMVMVVNPP